MSYVVPREKPTECRYCTFMDRISYDCRLMYQNDYPDFKSQYENCPLQSLSKIEKELNGKTPEEQYDFIYELLNKYGLSFTDSKEAIIEWLKG